MNTQAQLEEAYYNSFYKCFVIKVISCRYIADQSINVVKIFI